MFDRFITNYYCPPDLMDRLNSILTKLEKIMHTIAEFKQAIADIDTETTRIAAKIDELVAKLSDQGITHEQEHEVLADLGGVATRLREVGKDPDNPVPPTP